MKNLTFCLFILVLSLRASAQIPVPCPSSSTPPADECSQACVFCNLNDYSGQTAGYTPSFVTGFCGTIENDQWIGFVAAGVGGVFTASPSNCANGDGVQIALYDNCMSAPLYCAMGGAGYGTTPVFFTANGLVPGQTYFLEIDGFAGDQCDFSLNVNPPGVTYPNPPGATPPVSGPLNTCPGAVEHYSIPAVSNTGFYTWTAPQGALINGISSSLSIPAPEGDSIFIVWGDNSGQVCVTPSNACQAGEVACANVTVTPIPPTILPPVTICAEDAPYLLPWGEPANASGQYQTTLESVTGCDSIIRQNVIIKAPILVDLGLKVVCQGDCLSVCGSQFCNSGNYTAVCSSSQGCDSTVQFALVVLTATIQAPDGKSITCTTPEVELIGYPPSAPSWTNGLGQDISSSTVVVVDTPGFYTYSSAAAMSGVFCLVEKTVLVKQNTQVPDVTASGGVLDAAHPTVQLMGHSVIQPVQYQWTGPGGFVSQLPNPTVNIPGPYTLTVLNTGNGCSSSLTVNVTQQ